MSKLKTVVEAIVNNGGGEIDRVKLQPEPDDPDLFTFPAGFVLLRVGDIITIEEREEEVE